MLPLVSVSWRATTCWCRTVPSSRFKQGSQCPINPRHRGADLFRLGNTEQWVDLLDLTGRVPPTEPGTRSTIVSNNGSTFQNLPCCTLPLSYTYKVLQLKTNYRGSTNSSNSSSAVVQLLGHRVNFPTRSPFLIVILLNCCFPARGFTPFQITHCVAMLPARRLRRQSAVSVCSDRID